MAAGVRVHTSTVIHPTTGRWIAGERSGLGHHFPRSGVARAACGAYPMGEMFSYPVTWRCDACIALTGLEQLRDRRKMAR
jgi:hypothetical protein